MAFADTFQSIVDSLPGDWTDLEVDLLLSDESRYIDAASLLVTCNAQPYSKADQHFKLLVANRFGHAAAVPAVRAALRLLDDVAIDGTLTVRSTRAGRVPVTHSWGRPASVTNEFRRLNAQ